MILTHYFNRLSFNRKLGILVSPAIFLPLLILGFIIGSLLTSHTQAMHTDQLQAETKILSLLLSQRQSELTQGVRRVAADNTLQVTTDLKILAQLNKYLIYQAQTINFSSLMVTDTIGRTISAVGNEDSYCADMNLPQIFVRKNFVGICHAAIIKRNQKALGYLIGEMSISDNQFKQYLNSNLVNNYIIWVNGKPVISDLNFEPAKLDAIPAPSEEISDFTIGGSDYRIISMELRYNGPKVFISSLLPLKKYQSSIRKSFLVILVSIFLLFIFVLLILRLFLINLTTPIYQLAYASELLEKGKFQEIELNCKRQDEFGQLNVAFTNMAESLHGYIGEMEELVVKRTTELKNINKQLKKELSDRKKAQDVKEELIEELQMALNEITTLQGIIPICSSCKKIRSDQGAWTILEEYFSTHSDIDFSHGICPDCAKKLYPDYFDEIYPHDS